MTTSTLHTPLEELLFFQSLRADGVQPESFARISDLLKANEYIHSNETYDPERLSPGNLQQLYLRLLKDEVRSSNGNSKATATPGHEEQNSRKRKLSTPPLQSIDEASEHTHLLPRLIDRLYARYQSHVVEAIKEDERVYYNTQKDIDEIERGEWDARLQAEQSSQEVEETKNGTVLDIMRSETERANAIDNKDQVEGVSLIQDPAVNSQKAEPSTTATRATTPATTPAAVDTSQPPVAGTPPVPITATSSPPKAGASVVDSTAGHKAPKPDVFQPPQVPPLQTFTPIQSYSSSSRQNEPQRGTSATHSGFSRPEKPSNSPISLQPSTTPGKGAGSPTGPLENLSEQSTRTPQSNPPKYPQPGQLPNLPPHPQSLPPHPSNFNQQQRNYNYYSNQPYPPPQYAPYGGQPMPGYSPNQAQGMPPFPPPNQQGYPGVYHPHPPGSPYGSQSPYGSFPAFIPGQQPPRPGQPPLGAFSTPTVSGTRRAQNLTPINTAVSATKWKSTPRPAKGIPRSPTPPPRSPYLPSSPEPSPEPEQSAEKAGPQKGKQIPPSSRAEQTPTRGRGRGRWAGHSSRGRGGRGVSQSYDPKDTPTRSQSVASHHTDDHLTDTTVGATTTTRRGAAIKTEIPSTPLASAIDDNTSAMSTPGSTATGTAAATRTTGRRNTTRGLDANQPTPTSTSRAGTKRKRAPTLDGTAQSPADLSFYSVASTATAGGPAPPMTPALPQRPGYVLASRNFPRVTSTLMNDIMSHKLASIFAKPITDRDVPGYAALIYQPQDLKSIRLAISQGSRFVASLGDSVATDDVGTPDAAGTPGGSGAAGTGASGTGGPGKATLWVERTPDVLPPRGIVNSAQLEKEITRVFANAVMFNPDPARGFGPLLPRRKGGDGTGAAAGGGDGGNEEEDDDSVEGHYEVDDGGAFTRDAREMFVEVEGSVARWRAAERVEPVAVAATPVASGSGVGKVEKEKEKEKEESEGDEEGESAAAAGTSAGAGTGTGRGRRGRGAAAATG